ncbi:MAG: transporter substrate-binding protein [Myxococcales bacterium]|nr:transporter substrate-binding protein [Myxococcales bacterium]
MRAMLIACALAASSCSAVLKFHECDVDGDCMGQTDAGSALYCSDDHMCVGAIPDYKLCKVEVPANGIIPAGALVIGGIYRTSGANDVNDHAFRNAANLAAKEFNDSRQYSVAHVVCDTAGDPAQAARAYRVVIERFGAQVVVGADTSDEVFEVAKLVKEKGVPVVSPSATNPGITGLDDDGLIWRTAASDNLQSTVLAALPLATAKLDIIFVNDSNYTIGLKDAFVGSFAAKDGSVLRTLGFAAGDTAGLNAAVAMAAADAPSVALLIADFDAPPLMVAVSKSSGLSTTQFLMTDSAKKPSLWGQLTSYAVLSRVRGTGPANPAGSDPSGMAFSVLASNYRREFAGEDPTATAFVSNTYDAFYAAAIAGFAAPNRSGKAIAATLARLSSGTKVPVGGNSVTTAITTLQMGQNIDLIGTSGPIDFDDHGDIFSAPIEVWSVDNTASPPTFKQDSIVTP